MPTGTLPVPCTHTAHGQCTRISLFWVQIPIYRHFLEMWGLQLSTNPSCFLQLHNLQAGNRNISRGRWECPGHVPAVADSHSLSREEAPSGTGWAASSRANTTLMLLFPLLSPSYSRFTYFFYTSFQATPLVCLF